AIVDRNEVWERGSDDVWRARATWDVDLSAIHVHGSSVFVGTYDARLLRLNDGVLEPVEAFDTAPGRDEWHRVGPPLNVRSMTSTSDAGALLANVHVGGIMRSTDDGATWASTIAVDDDVHQVRAHPFDPSLVVAAAAVGLCRSDDGGATWAVDVDGLPDTYARAVAFSGDDVLVSVSDGPFARRSALYACAVRGGPLTRLAQGLPDEGLEGNVDTACLDAQGTGAALADGGGNVWTRDGDDPWRRIAGSVGDVRAVALA
ncbi:MAG: WD40/YVTN/BNR-like repeat-containing protein, partial [Acidimicrobiia bacterium]